MLSEKLINPSSHKAQELQVCHFAAIQATTYISLKDLRSHPQTSVSEKHALPFSSILSGKKTESICNKARW